MNYLLGVRCFFYLLLHTDRFHWDIGMGYILQSIRYHPNYLKRLDQFLISDEFSTNIYLYFFSPPFLLILHGAIPFNMHYQLDPIAVIVFHIL